VSGTKGGLAVAVVLIAAAITAEAAPAATTRAEYVAQVDQVCGSYSPQFAKLSRAFKKISGKLKNVPTESDAQEKRRFNRILRGLGRYVGQQARVFVAMSDQIALVSPAQGDEEAVRQWLQGLRQFAVLQGQSGPALTHHRFGQAAALSQESIAALNSGGAAVKDFGISTCLVTIDVSVTTTYG
jgi:hypothetical protein